MSAQRKHTELVDTLMSRLPHLEGTTRQRFLTSLTSQIEKLQVDVVEGAAAELRHQGPLLRDIKAANQVKKKVLGLLEQDLQKLNSA